MRPDPRRGSLLVIVAGIAALLLSLSVAVLVMSRSLGEPGALVLAEARNRLLLAGALAYLQETSRLGWGAGPGDSSWGWTDVRDGKPGPRGARDASGETQPQRWSPGGGYPAPGGALRGDPFAWKLPPYAVAMDLAPNPYRLEDADATPARWEPLIGAGYTSLASRATEANPLWVGARARMKRDGQQGYYSPPVLDSWAAFSFADPAVRSQYRVARPESVGQGWFRIYRERPEDHDGDGSPWYDTMPIGGHGVFVVTVGSGATRGFRFWNRVTDRLNDRDALPGGLAPASSALEPVTAEESRMFPDEATFRTLRQSERIAWFRVQWVAQTTSGLDPIAVFGTELSYNNTKDTRNRFQAVLTQTDRTNDFNTMPFTGGVIRLVQRLEQEPPAW